MSPAVLEKVPGYMGHLVINEEGAVSSSGGDLENDEHTASVIYQMIHVTSKKNLTLMEHGDGFKRMCVYYDQFAYLITMSNRSIHVVKRRNVAHPDPINI